MSQAFLRFQKLMAQIASVRAISAVADIMHLVGASEFKSRGKGGARAAVKGHAAPIKRASIKAKNVKRHKAHCKRSA